MPEIHVSRIDPHPANIREELGDLTELAASIRVHGILQPLVVTEQGGRYQLLAGHRRLAAAKLARLETVPAVVRRAPRRGEATAVMLVENCQRSDLGPVEKAEAMGRLRDEERMTASQIAQAIGLSVPTVSYYLSLLDLDEASRARVSAGTVQVGEAIAAVRTTRASARKQRGPQSPRPVVTVAAEHFSGDHPLAEDARVMCELAGHTGRKYGTGGVTKTKVACGQCWETVIRQDERRGSRLRSVAS